MKLGHAHLKVRDLQIADIFYTSLLGLKVTERVGEDFVFLSFGAAHHDLALQSIGRAAPLSPFGAVGLYHVAFEVSDAKSLLSVIDKLDKLRAKMAMIAGMRLTARHSGWEIAQGLRTSRFCRSSRPFMFPSNPCILAIEFLFT